MDSWSAVEAVAPTLPATEAPTSCRRRGVKARVPIGARARLDVAGVGSRGERP